MLQTVDQIASERLCVSWPELKRHSGLPLEILLTEADEEFRSGSPTNVSDEREGHEEWALYGLSDSGNLGPIPFRPGNIEVYSIRYLSDTGPSDCESLGETVGQVLARTEQFGNHLKYLLFRAVSNRTERTFNRAIVCASSTEDVLRIQDDLGTSDWHPMSILDLFGDFYNSHFCGTIGWKVPQFLPAFRLPVPADLLNKCRGCSCRCVGDAWLDAANSETTSKYTVKWNCKCGWQDEMNLELHNDTRVLSVVTSRHRIPAFS